MSGVCGQSEFEVKANCMFGVVAAEECTRNEPRIKFAAHWFRGVARNALTSQKVFAICSGKPRRAGEAE